MKVIYLINKNEEAYIKVLFKRKGLYRFQVVIRDDGKGIDVEKIRENVRKGYEEMNMEKEEMFGTVLVCVSQEIVLDL